MYIGENNIKKGLFVNKSIFGKEEKPAVNTRLTTLRRLFDGFGFPFG
jgi:hypothetical protein